MNEQMPPVTGEPQKKSNTTLIIAIVAVVVLCCCCIGAWAAWTYGDTILQGLNF
jgi:flagellar basal body-associated protein FliL